MHNQSSNKKELIRVWVDGCFDLVHFGHANALRQAKSLGDQLIVGIHSDKEITKHKGPPVFHEQERYRLIRAMKWVDEVVEDAPYFTYIKTLEKYSCDFCVHGDDLVVSNDGSDPYGEVKAANRYKEVKRTEGISTTALVSRMLKRIQQLQDQGTYASQLSSSTEHSIRRTQSLDSVLKNKDKFMHPCKTNETLSPIYPSLNSNGPKDNVTDSISVSIWSTGGMTYMPNILRISQFCSGQFREPSSSDIVVYIPGTFDLFHIGHLSFLEECLKLGNYLLVGLHSDKTSSFENGQIGSILTLQERLLSVLACRYVSNVIIDAPYVIPASLLDHFKVNYVAIGWDKKLTPTLEGLDPMKICKERGILRRIDSGCNVTTSMVISRIMKNRLLYEERNMKKVNKEIELASSIRQTNN
ncbi:Ethanolamine-phosphate cytidylyltransferase isoform 1 [Schistosoma japonicum]|uniref:ethanolamine-phosphate cytidylyltransferase n=2 Tax=Schistosoma japonicum TaxID=6182 RepID=Q5DH65_SCHJA|nr:SJCHGC06128 protein [Schistosoma japonicum]TNN21133.1 Ethanolamine-phosphate cytidylyltransferase isoform 1 [Schistosoma japonicum]